MDTAANLRSAQAIADSGRRDGELASLCNALVDDPSLPESARGRVLVWLSEALLATNDPAGVARAVAQAALLELPTAQRRALERALMAARNKAAGRVPVPKPALTPPPRPVPVKATRTAAKSTRAAGTAAPARKAPARRTASSTARPAGPVTPPAVQRLLAATAPDEALIVAAAEEVDATSLARAAAELRKRDLPRVAADLGRRSLDQHAGLRSSSVAVVAVASAFEDCGQRDQAEHVITPLLTQGPEGLTTDRFLLTAGLRVVTDESLAERIRARLEAG